MERGKGCDKGYLAVLLSGCLHRAQDAASFLPFQAKAPQLALSLCGADSCEISVHSDRSLAYAGVGGRGPDYRKFKLELQ